MNINQIAAAYWNNMEAAPALADLVRDILDQHPATSPPLGSTKLLKALLPDANTQQAKNIFIHLKTARDKGLFEGYFSTDTTRKTFGHYNILWHTRKERVYTDEERLANQRKILGE